MKKEEYESLQTSTFTPPPIVFKIVWPILYVLMMASFFLFLWKEDDQEWIGITFFVVQLFLNLAWIYLSFVLRKWYVSFWILILLFVFLLGTLISFGYTDWISAILLLPYCLWIMFAIYLQAYLVYKNNL